ncbi:MAG TPA: hypothetical protein VFN48_02850, partial [Solirubrobacteraceae bacterium]|nr:hypothetical protein [Solirubrobacteraceae bacterium]
PACTARLRVDQRYCVECGTRTRPLPRFIAAALAALRAGIRADLPELVAADGLTAHAGAKPAGVATRRPRPLTGRTVALPWSRPIALPAGDMPSPRAIAVAILGVVAFSVAVGSGNVSVASSPLTLLLHAAPGSGTPLALSAPGSGASAATGGSAGGAGGPGVASSPAGGGNVSGGGGGGTGAGSGPAGPGGSGAGATGTSTAPGTARPADVPPISHVWLITLGDEGFAQTWGPTSPDSYLRRTLVREGELVPAYYATATSDLANEIGMLSGQGPTNAILADCPTYSPVMPGSLAINGQVIGDGCVMPAGAGSIFDQLTAAHQTWRAYVAGLGGPRPATHRRTASATTGAATALTCRHPLPGHRDNAHVARGPGSDVTWRNPAVYFASVTASAACADEDVGLSQLPGDLKSPAHTPALSLIYPGPCEDGSETGPGTPCPSLPASGDPVARANHFLARTLAEIQASPAYAKGRGLILITFAMAAQSGPTATAASQAACCDIQTYLNVTDGSSVSSGSSTTTGSPTTPGPTTTTTATGTDTATTTTGTGTSTTTGTSTGTTPTTTGTTGTSTGTTATATATGTGTTATPGCPAAGTATTGAEPTSATATTPASTATTPSSTGTGTSTSTPGTTTAGTTSDTSTTTCVPAPTVDDLGNPLTGGGGQVGLLAISKWVTPGSLDQVDAFNHFSLLASLEALFGLKPLGFAAKAGATFGHYFYSAFTPGG